MKKNETKDQNNEELNEEIDQLFPNALFDIAMELEELDEVVTDRQDIVVKHTYTCYCFDDCKKNTEYFYITCNSLHLCTFKMPIKYHFFQ